MEDFFPTGIETIEAAEAYLEALGGYGWIEVDGERVMHVRS